MHPVHIESCKRFVDQRDGRAFGLLEGREERDELGSDVIPALFVMPNSALIGPPKSAGSKHVRTNSGSKEFTRLSRMNSARSVE